jgi:hypothetical protein
MRRYLVSIVAIIPLAFSSAVTAGDYQDGRDAYDVGNFDKAMAVWAPAAESGDADSQYGMGLLYTARHSTSWASCTPTAGACP